MPLVCSICTHPERRSIDAQLIRGESLRRVAQQFGTSATALHRHRRAHLQAVVKKAVEQVEQAGIGDVRQFVEDQQNRFHELRAAALQILNDAPEGSVKLCAIREARGIEAERRAAREFLARVSGELEARPVATLAIAVVLPQRPGDTSPTSEPITFDIAADRAHEI